MYGLKGWKHLEYRILRYPTEKGEAYKFCLFAKTAQETKLEVSVIENNVCFASTTLLLKGNGYVKYDAVLAATGDSQNAKLYFGVRMVERSCLVLHL